MVRFAYNFLRLGMWFCAACILIDPLNAQDDGMGEPSQRQESEVYYVLNASAVLDHGVRTNVIHRMVDSVVKKVAGKSDIGTAWREFVKPKDRVGIKVSTLGAPISSTHAAVVEAVARGLEQAGVSAGNIVIWDRLERNVRNAGYEELGKRYRVVSTEKGGGYLEKEIAIAAVMGKLIIGDLDFKEGVAEQVSSKSHLSSVLVNDVDKVVHVPSLTDSVFTGVHGALAGMVLDNLDNWRRLGRAPHFGDPYLPELYMDPRIGGKVVLTIMDALRPQFGGGPFPGAQYQENYGAIFASRDPVALDATAIRLLDDFRKKEKMEKLSKIIHWPESAEVIGVGNAEESRIKIQRIGLESEVRLNPRDD